jgi:hypothetical protein
MGIHSWPGFEYSEQLVHQSSLLVSSPKKKKKKKKDGFSNHEFITH